MKFLKQSTNPQPKISLILLDWGVRESFHLLHYLSLQTVDRANFEVILIEYYSTRSKAAEQFNHQIDTWLLLEMPQHCYYHKHLMYNAGIVVANGDIIVICDSDSMVKKSFIETIISEFEKNENLVLHIDQFRNNNKEFYPFNYPSFEEVTGKGCVNHKNGKTTGLWDTKDTLHSRNYGACMCAKRNHIISIGGSDEHVDFVGYICGPYDLTFRLINKGLKEKWHENEFMYHTWHPGQAGIDNYIGHHDGRYMSTTALEALVSRRLFPHIENQAIRCLRTRTDNDLLEKLIDPLYQKKLDKSGIIFSDFGFMKKQKKRLLIDASHYKFKKILSKIKKKIVLARKNISNVNNFIVLLSMLSQCRNTKINIIISSNLIKHSINVLSIIKILPKINMLVIKNGHSISEHSGLLSKMSKDASFVICEDLYLKNHTAIRSLSLSNKLRIF